MSSPWLRLALRSLRREWRAGELRVLFVALVVAVASIAAVGVFTDRMDRAMEIGATELLAADLVVVSSNPIDEAYETEAARRGVEVAHTLTTRSVVVAGDALQLAALKAVDATYPLRGQLETSEEPFALPVKTADIPAPGTAWADARLLSLLSVRVGDSVDVGATRLRIGQVLALEPDRGGEVFNIAPRLLINLADLPATRLVQPGSRVRHRTLFAGSPTAMDGMREWLEGALAPGEELQGIRDARPEVRAALTRAEQFLGLAALVSVLLVGVA
ncbi:MAG: ABC transporter permease, partial [Gammaproteobacteria bacterium]